MNDPQPGRRQQPARFCAPAEGRVGGSGGVRLVNWLAADEPDLTVGPAIDCRDRVLAVGRMHPLAQRPVVDAEELADYENTGFIESLPATLLDAIMPPRTPSGRPVSRTHSRGVYEMQDEVARGTAVHPTMAGIVFFRRDDIVLIPIDGLPPLPLGLIWCTGHENARIRALAATARRLRPGNGPQGTAAGARTPT